MTIEALGVASDPDSVREELYMMSFYGKSAMFKPQIEYECMLGKKLSTQTKVSRGKRRRLLSKPPRRT